MSAGRDFEFQTFPVDINLHSFDTQSQALCLCMHCSTKLVHSLYKIIEVIPIFVKLLQFHICIFHVYMA